MSSAQGSLAQQQLCDVNDLTRASPEPGNLDYITYCWYLNMIGHVKSSNAPSDSQANNRAQNSTLQQRTGDRNDKKTDFRADQAQWSTNNLPDLIYAFERPERWIDKFSLRDPPLKTYPIYGSYLRDIPILPDHISIDLEGWRLEAWTRFDPRVGLEDILQRINPLHRPKHKSLVQMRTSRFREHCHLLGWTAPGSAYNARKKHVHELMRLIGVDTKANTTRGLTWGLIDPASGPGGERIEVPASQAAASTVEKVTPEMLQSLPVTVLPQPNNPRSMPDVVSSRALVIPATPQKRKRKVVDHTDYEESEVEDTTSSTSANTNIDTNTQLTASVTPTPPPRPQRPRLPRTPVSRITATRILSNIPVTPPVAVMYHGKRLVLKSPIERWADQQYVNFLRQQFHPVGSPGRRRQLAYLLDPNRLAAGFVDNRGRWPPVGYQGCLDTDIIYGR